MATAMGDEDDEPGEIFVEFFHKGLDDENLQEQRDEISAIESYYEGSDFERLRILSSPDNDGRGLYFINITIPIQEQTKPVTMDIMLPVYSNDEIKAPSFPGVNFMRSDSGQRWVGCLKIDYLSPLILQVSLPPSYPSSHESPVYTLSSSWLSPCQLTALCKKLDLLWKENCGMVIIYTWVDWLENNILSFLNIDDSVVLKPFEEDDIRDPRAFPESVDFGNNIISILKYSRQQVEFEFCKNDQDCDVCFDRLPGNYFFRIGNCGHHYCRECMTEYCEIHVTAGTVEELKCPDRECDNIIPPYIVQSVLPPGAYNRWERLVLQKSLTYMDDVVWCPRCNEAVIKEVEPSLNLAHCITCFYSFCTECSETWHQGKTCESAEDKLEEMDKQKVPANDKAEQRRYQELRHKILEEIEMQRMMKAKIKHCPKCRLKIEKISGCNKMTCRCGQCFCWICGHAITGYNHFNDNTCVLFAGPDVTPANRVVHRQPADGNLWIQANLDVNPDARRRLIVCPMCRQNNLKAGTNNHIKCWNCKTNFCFICKTRIKGVITNHYIASTPCQQHS